MASIVDDRGYNQGFKLVESTVVRMRRRAQMFLDQMDLSRSGDVLEIGCGTGEISNWIAEGSAYSVLGTDICAPFIQSAASRYVRGNLRYEVVDFNDPAQVKGRTFDYVVGNGILHHLYPNLESCLVTIRSLLRPGGKMLFMEPNIYNPYCAVIFNFTRSLAKLEPGEMAFSRRYISRLIKRAGFAEQAVSYRDFLVPGIPSPLIRPSIALSACLERIPVVNHLSQSLFIEAAK